MKMVTANYTVLRSTSLLKNKKMKWWYYMKEFEWHQNHATDTHAFVTFVGEKMGCTKIEHTITITQVVATVLFDDPTAIYLSGSSFFVVSQKFYLLVVTEGDQFFWQPYKEAKVRSLFLETFWRWWWRRRRSIGKNQM